MTPHTIIMDNVRFHKTSDVKQWFDNSVHYCRYLPPYSPFLNVVEEAISKMKFFVRQQHRNFPNTVLDSTGRGICCITSMDCWSWVQHTKQFYDECLHQQHIISTVPTSGDDEDNEESTENKKNNHADTVNTVQYHMLYTVYLPVIQLYLCAYKCMYLNTSNTNLSILDEMSIQWWDTILIDEHW